ncbi:MAG: hypothetical protein HOG03_08215 [Desulfobacula sp.]|nr:hypothetical protein [Desulfobacula sp.]MBT3485124.1 hypothetical protein [Desulfobacula sp.]MBT3804572.1 hypothetical protein [Desulfobacula sp.]MBT4025135.1 hypothetical protein [Desulfobacula sp.]MBT4198289.1 hypothetical protein [Desulfobacula sp.]
MVNAVYKKIELKNNQTLIISDLSRKISADAYVVIMKAIIEIKIEKELFSNDLLSDFKFQDIIAELGDKMIYEFKTERNFIMDKEKDRVFKELFKTFLDNLGQYVAKPEFPGKFIIKEYKDRIKQT